MSDRHPPACTGRRVPTWREALTVWHHDPSRPPWGIVQRAPKQAMVRALAPVADTAWTSPGASGARAPPVPPGNRPRRFHHAVSARTPHGRLGSPLDSALGPGLHVFSSPRTGRSWIHSRHEGGTRRGGNAESHNSASSRQQQAYRRSTAWPQAGLRRRTASSPSAAGSGIERRSAGRPAPRCVTQAGRAIRTGPEPGHLNEGGAPGANGGRWDRSDGGRTDRVQARTAVIRE
jgi:hypothetical protein